MKPLSPQQRRYLYRLALAVVAALVTYGAIEATDVDVWVALVTALLGVPLVMADRHVPDAPDYQGRHRADE